MRRDALPPLLDAVAATVAADGLEPDERETLLEPISQVGHESTRDRSRAPTSLIVGVVGAGTMGAGIAQVCLQAGHEVQLHDVDHAAIERGRGRIADGLARLVDKGRLTDDDRARMLSSLRDAHSLHELAAESDVVIEAALEDIELKRTIFRALGAEAAQPRCWPRTRAR